MGGSTGINVAGAIRLAKQMGPGHTIVTVLCDYGTRYQSKLFNPAFLREKGLPVPEWLEAPAQEPAERVRRGPAAEMTNLLFRDDAYLRDCEARSSASTSAAASFWTDGFYATAGGQPGDKGTPRCRGQTPFRSRRPSMTRRRMIVHVPACRRRCRLPEPGDVAAALDWDTRYRNMRVHTALHLLCALVPFPVTGGRSPRTAAASISTFPMPAAVDRATSSRREING